MSRARNLANFIGSPATTISSNLPSGAALQVVNGITPTTATPANTSEVSIANVTPQATGFYVLITPSATSSKILVFGRVTTGVNYSSGETYWEVYRGIDGATPSYVASISNQTNAAAEYSNNYSIQSTPLVIHDTPNTSLQVRYEIYARSHSNGHYIYINKSGSVSYGTTHMFAMEIK